MHGFFRTKKAPSNLWILMKTRLECHFTMAECDRVFKHMLSKLNDKSIIEQILYNYVTSSSLNYMNVLELLDVRAINVMIDLNNDTLRLFYHRDDHFHLTVKIKDLLPDDCDLVRIMHLMQISNIRQNHCILPELSPNDLYVWYAHCIDQVDFPTASNLVTWKLTAIQSTQHMQPGRSALWLRLWTDKFEHYTSMHELFGLLLHTATGELPQFVQVVYAYLLDHMSKQDLETFLEDVVYPEWQIDANMHLQFLVLWRTIVWQVACRYCLRGNEADYSTLRSGTQRVYMLKYEKLLCLLLLLFHRPYVLQLRRILSDDVSEPPPPFLTNLIRKYPYLSPLA